MYIFFIYAVSLLSLAPLRVFGAVTTPTNFKSLVELFTNIIGILVALVFSLTVIVFLTKIIKNWIMNGGDAESVEKGKNVFIVGIITLAIMSAIWGILHTLQTTFFGG